LFGNEAWISLKVSIRKRASFRAEQWGPVSQMRRVDVSVPSNIAEGYGRQATGNYRQHLSIVRGSLLELETQVLLARDWGICAQKKPALCLLKSKKLAKR
jgi:four helix bundle protein